MKQLLTTLAILCLTLSATYAQRNVKITQSLNVIGPTYDKVNFGSSTFTQSPGMIIENDNGQVELKLNDRFWINSNSSVRIIDSLSNSLVSLGIDTLVVGGFPLSQNGVVNSHISNNWICSFSAAVNSINNEPSTVQSVINSVTGKSKVFIIDTTFVQVVLYNNQLNQDVLSQLNFTDNQIFMQHDSTIVIATDSLSPSVVLAQNLVLNNLPTDSAGLPTNAIWVDGDVLKIKP